MDISLLTKKELSLTAKCFLFFRTDEAFLLRALEDDLCVLSEFEKDSVVYDIDDYQKNAGLILSGRIEASKLSQSGGSFVMNDLGPGSLFGVAAIWNEEPDYVTKLTAKSRCRVLFFPEALLKTLMTENFSVAENYISFLSGRIRFLNDKIDGLIISSATDTLKHWLLENSRLENGRRTVKISGSLSSLAAMLNIGRASLYRSFSELESTGFLKRDGKTIELL